ncbi:MAG: hypothetical protein RML95_14640 [Anaerolineae bacterium]|nr:hypothetical protein [Anaerolineae bacterium]MDW8300565.1 hypothetical protein [Anaerolineae bacterium]
MLRRYCEGCFYLGCLAPLGFSALALWIVADAARRAIRQILGRAR